MFLRSLRFPRAGACRDLVQDVGSADGSLTVRRPRLVALRTLNPVVLEVLDIAPDLEQYFIASHHDDIAGIMQTRAGLHVGPSQILAATPTIVAIIDAVLSGVIVVPLVDLVTDHHAVSTTAGVISAIAVAAFIVGILPMRKIRRFNETLTPRFPSRA